MINRASSDGNTLRSRALYKQSVLGLLFGLADRVGLGSGIATEVIVSDLRTKLFEVIRVHDALDNQAKKVPQLEAENVAISVPTSY